MKKRFAKIWGGLVDFVFRCSEDYVTVHAAYSALFIFMAFFPTVLFILLILAKINISREYLVSQLLNVLPANFHDFIRNIVENLQESASGFSLSFSIILAIWTSSAGVYGLVLGLNDVYRTYDTRSYVWRRSISIFHTLVLILAVVLSLLLLVFGNTVSSFIISKWPDLENLLNFITKYKYPFIFLILTLIFSLAYRFLPYMKSRWIYHLPGAVLASAGWLLLSFLFGIYIDNFPSDAMYGSLTTIVLFLVWLWVAMCILYVGAELNSYILDAKKLSPTNLYREKALGSIKEMEKSIADSGELTKTGCKSLHKVTERARHIDEIKSDLRKSGEKVQTDKAK